MKPQAAVNRPQCRHCSVPVEAGDTCAFCKSYTPPEAPAQQLDVAVNLIDLARADGNKVLQDLPRDTGLFQVVDLVAGLGHLRAAAVLFDKVADALESEAVQR